MRHPVQAQAAQTAQAASSGLARSALAEFGVPLPLPLPHPLALFTNPIVLPAPPGGSADPSVVFHEGRYHYCRSLADGALGVASAARLQDIGREAMVVVWRPQAGTAWSSQIWAPELQCVKGRWTIYFAASDGENRNHRMYVLQADTPDPQGGYTFKGKVALPKDCADCWAIDGIAVEHAGGLYFVWSGWRQNDDGFPQVLYIAPMSDACTISGERRELAAPLHAWERHGAALIEGPAVLYAAGRIFLSYSASGSWTDDYALGLLAFSGGDILSPNSWVRSDTPRFMRCAKAGVFGPGHNSFVKSPDGQEDWMVYHATDRAGGGWARRSVRAQRIGWSADGEPELGLPVASGKPITEPSGSPRLNPADAARLALVAARQPRPTRKQKQKQKRTLMAAAVAPASNGHPV